MRAAIYARYSTDKQSEASIDDQLRVCARLAQQHGYAVVARFDDAAISGGTAQRPGYQALLDGARRHDFDVIVADEVSRLWRNMAEQAPRLAELADLGVMVRTRDFYSGDESAALLGGVRGIVAEEERRKIGPRVFRGQEGNALAGKSTGGRAYGYRSEPVIADGRVTHTLLQVDEETAPVVRRIFEMYADGVSPRAIAAQLNTEGVPSPGAKWRRTVRRADGKWLASAIHGDQTRGTGILNNRRYTGVVTWGRSKWTRGAVDSSKRRQRQLEKPAVERTEERLRIIPDELWQRVKERQNARSALVGEAIKGALEKVRKTRPGSVRELLSGLLVCGECGRPFWNTGGNRRHHYVCSSYHQKTGTCTNGLRVSQTLAEELIVEQVLALIEAGKVDATVAGVKRRKGRRSEPVRRVNPELAKARARIGDLEKMISTHVMTTSEGEGPLSRARAAVEALERDAHLAPVVDLRAAAEEFRGWAGKLRRALGGADVGQAREALRQIVGQIVLRPHTERGERRALKAHETMDGKGIAAGTWEDRYLVARFTRRAADLPLHPVLTAAWFEVAGLSHQDGSGGRQPLILAAIPRLQARRYPRGQAAR